MTNRANNCRIIIIVDDFVLLPSLLALREYLIGTEGVSPKNISMSLATPLLAGGVPATSTVDHIALGASFAISSMPLEELFLNQDTLDNPLEIIWSDTHIAHESFEDLRDLIRRASQGRGEITLSLGPDGSANSASALSEEDLMALLQSDEGTIRLGSYYSYGYISVDAAERRPSFHHKAVAWALVECYFRGSELWVKPPYPDLASLIDSYIEDPSSVIWIPLRAICNNEDYHGGNYQFGQSEPTINTFKIYRRLLDLLVGAKPELTSSPVVLVGDMRTEKILQGQGHEIGKNLIGDNCFYFVQPFEVRFDFLIADFARRFPDAHNYVICGDSTTSIPLCGCSHRASFVMGYPMPEYRNVGATKAQCQYVNNRVGGQIRDAMTVLFATEKVRTSTITFKKLEDGTFFLDVQRLA